MKKGTQIMAIFRPTMQEILENQMEKPTPGELELLKKLRVLSNNYTVYFQPHVNSLHPDIVIVKENCGVMILEVKDWNLNAYEFEADFNYRRFGVMREKSGHHEIRNPFEQVSSYKDELFNMYSSTLYLKNLTDTSVYGIVKAGVYFANSSEEQVRQFFGRKNFKERNFLEYYPFWAGDSNDLVNDISSMLCLNHYFTYDVYREITSLFTPSLELIEQAQVFSLSNEQKKYAKSEAGKRQKIKGVAGSGKTLVLAQRAVNCYQRTKDEVLILTFNVTLKNYIHDKISRVTRTLTNKDKKNFVIESIHDFARKMMEENSIHFSSANMNENEDEEIDPDVLLRMRFDCLKQNSYKIRNKYQAILIDEVQDFEFDWLCNVEELFLAKNGEFVLFGDEKQNIYNRSVDEKKLPRTRISGPWSLLKGSYRLTEENCRLATEFQSYFFKDKYEKTPVRYEQLTLDNISPREEFRYYYIPDNTASVEDIFNIVDEFRSQGIPISFNDICMLSDNHGFLREMNDYLNKVRRIKAETITETKEEYEQLYKAYGHNRKKLKRALHGVRKIEKVKFFMNPGTMKLCTIQSFKGWEINTIVLILEPQDQPELQDELIYTAITRARSNLVIINLGNDRYHEFFKEEEITRLFGPRPS